MKKGIFLIQGIINATLNEICDNEFLITVKYENDIIQEQVRVYGDLNYASQRFHEKMDRHMGIIHMNNAKNLIKI